MTPRDIVLSQINHHETAEIPYTLPFEEDVGRRLDAHYGGAAWRQRIKPYLAGFSAVETDPKTPIDAKYVRDRYGGIWREDLRPSHLEMLVAHHGRSYPQASTSMKAHHRAGSSGIRS